MLAMDTMEIERRNDAQKKADEAAQEKARRRR